MKVLLDTCTLSELRNDTGYKCKILSAIAAVDDADIFVSVISLGEIVKGLALLQAGRKNVSCSPGWMGYGKALRSA